jgi:flagellar basal body rod protein FlgB
MDQRLQWLSARTQVLTDNLSRADMLNQKRRELKPFGKIVAERKTNQTGKETSTRHIDELIMKPDDVTLTRAGISREHEMIELSKNAAEHEAFVSLMKKLHRLFQIASTKA